MVPENVFFHRWWLDWRVARVVGVDLQTPTELSYVSVGAPARRLL